MINYFFSNFHVKNINDIKHIKMLVILCLILYSKNCVRFSVILLHNVRIFYCRINCCT